MNSAKLPLTSFRKWLISEKKISPISAVNYVSLVRQLLRDEDRARALTEDATLWESELLAHDLLVSQQRTPLVRTAIRAFVAFTGKRLSTTFPDRRAKRWEVVRQTKGEVYLALAPLVREVEQRRIPFGIIPRIRWRDVAIDGEDAFVQDVQEKKRHRISIPLARALGMWAGGGAPPTPSIPFIPIEPKSLDPMPKNEIRRIARGP